VHHGIPTVNTAITTVATINALDERNLRNGGGPASWTRRPEMNVKSATLLNIILDGTVKRAVRISK
jgi:hypothetical protein